MKLLEPCPIINTHVIKARKEQILFIALTLTGK